MTPVTPRNILQHELIGLEARVVESANESHKSIAGRVVDESRNTLVIRQGGEIKRVPKRDATFRFILPDGEVEVEGKAIHGRPADRVKKKIKRRW